MPAQNYTGHADIFKDSIGLSGTDNSLIGEKVAFFGFFKSRFQPKQEKSSSLPRKIGRWEDKHSW